ncbi:hypothetical protein [Catellatospora sichuanensis]|uniref:hypothetical protein n=1 Tax=Catellatospora sichuanensis TaxID=1969805 RepID=UPI001184694D|nr:hypothetical protein [Catellatospora sichuanensis]
MVNTFCVTATTAGPDLVLSGINEREANGGAHAFELYGDFPANANVRPVVTCNGKVMPAEMMAPPLRTQINVNVEAMPAGSTCTFFLERLSDGSNSGARSVVTGPIPIQINGMADRGVTGGRRFVELYGSFAHAPSLQARVVCGGRYAGGRVEFASFGQINVSLPDAGPAGACTFVLRQPGTGLASPVFGSAPAATDAALPGFGGYFYGGVPPHPAGSLVRGQAFLDSAGFDTARLVITPRVRSGDPIDNYYNFDLDSLNAACPPTTAFLPCAISRPEYQTVMSPASVRKIVLTAYDSASSGSSGQSADYVDPVFWQNPSNRDAVFREYRDLAYALYETQNDTGKTFVIASWEADNQAYCGSFYDYWTKPGFRTSCGDIPSRDRAIAAITEWFKVRRDGISAGQRLARDAGYGGVTVSDGVEFNMNTLTNIYDVGGTVLRSVLKDVVPSVRPGYVLYSAYDSQNRGRMEQDLREIRDWLGTSSPGAQLAVGEVGFPRHAIDGVDGFRTVETAKAVQRVGLPIAILWEAFDTNSGDRVRPYGLLHATGGARAVMDILRRELQAQATEMATNPSARILAAADRGVTPIGGIDYRFFELYGSFPSGPFTATALCDGTETPIDVVHQSAGQVNVRLRHAGVEQRYCTMRLVRGDGTRSLAFGPVID